METFDLIDQRTLPAEQRSEQWYAARRGKLTASKAAVIMGGLNTSGLDTYVKTLAWERVYGARDEDFQSQSMLRGLEVEPQARRWYAAAIGQEVGETGFVQHPQIAYVGASPDGLLADRTLQIKCPLHCAWMEVRKTMRVPAEYRWQCRWEAWVCGLRLADFVCFHPQAGGLLIPLQVSDEECDQMASRAELVDQMVGEWVELLKSEQRIAA